MRVFISWSTSRSKAVASALRDWLPEVIQRLDPWMSESDIMTGQRWSTEIKEQLNQAAVGIICVTPENVDRPWLNFEAGALSHRLTGAKVTPYLLAMDKAEVKGPLSQFQMALADREGTWDMMQSLNASLGGDGLPPERLRKAFDKHWSDLEPALVSAAKLATMAPAAPKRTVEDMVAEVLEVVREQERRFQEQQRATGRLRAIGNIFDREMAAGEGAAQGRNRYLDIVSGRTAPSAEEDAHRAALSALLTLAGREHGRRQGEEPQGLISAVLAEPSREAQATTAHPQTSAPQEGQ